MEYFDKLRKSTLSSQEKELAMAFRALKCEEVYHLKIPEKSDSGEWNAL